MFAVGASYNSHSALRIPNTSARTETMEDAYVVKITLQFHSISHCKQTVNVKVVKYRKEMCL